MGGEPVRGTVVIQSTGAASSYAFWFFVQREVVFFFVLFQSSLAGARGGQVVAVLVLGPKPQPLLVLLLWFFGSVLSRATWEEGETGDETLALSRSSAAANICSGYSVRQTFKTRSNAGSVLIEKLNLPELRGPTQEKRRPVCHYLLEMFYREELHRQALPFLNLTDLASLERGCWQHHGATISICGFFSTDFLQQSKGCTQGLQSRTVERNGLYVLIDNTAAHIAGRRHCLGAAKSPS